MRLILFLALLAPTLGIAQPTAADAHEQLADAERAWLDAYVTNDRAAMAEALADGFTIVFPTGAVQTRDALIGSLAPEPTPRPPAETVHYTEGRTIRILGDTAILSGVYVNPAGGARMRYTDTWMWLDGRWRVVASHLSQARD